MLNRLTLSNLQATNSRGVRGGNLVHLPLEMHSIRLLKNRDGGEQPEIIIIIKDSFVCVPSKEQGLPDRSSQVGTTLIHTLRGSPGEV